MAHPDGNAATDLTGAWHGRYSYPQAVSTPVPFEASLISTEDFLGGTITEHAGQAQLKGRILCASVVGRQSGHDVSFVKTYEPGNEPYTSVRYDGVVSRDGQEISGDWKVGAWSGRFLMIRAKGVAGSVARRIHLDLPVT